MQLRYIWCWAHTYYFVISCRGSRDYSSKLPVAICSIECSSDASSISQCTVQYNPNGCGCSHYDDVVITCHDDDDGSCNNAASDSGGLSFGGIAGTVTASLSICGCVVLLAICRVYARHSRTRQRNQTYVITQQRPRILVARVTRTTVPSGSPPPPPYTPTKPTSDYTPVPPRGYQPVATGDYTTTPTAPSSDVPSEPPPEYTPSVSTDDVPMLTVQ